VDQGRVDGCDLCCVRRGSEEAEDEAADGHRCDQGDCDD
jgi:hypothetical protein